jgi:hypothetical protein
MQTYNPKSLKELVEILVNLPDVTNPIQLKNFNKTEIEYEHLGFLRYIGGDKGRHARGSTLAWIHSRNKIDGFTKADFLKNCHCENSFNALKNAGIIKFSHREGLTRYYKSVYSEKVKTQDFWAVKG